MTIFVTSKGREFSKRDGRSLNDPVRVIGRDPVGFEKLSKEELERDNWLIIVKPPKAVAKKKRAKKPAQPKTNLAVEGIPQDIEQPVKDLAQPLFLKAEELTD